MVSAGAFIKAVLERGLQAELADHLSATTRAARRVVGRRTRAPARLWRRSRPRSVRWRSTSRGFQGFFNALGGTAFADWLFMLGIGAALSFGFGMRVAAVTGAPLDTLMWVASFPLENSPMLHDRVLGAVSVVVLGFTLAGDTWGVGMAWARTQLVRAHPFLR